MAIGNLMTIIGIVMLITLVPGIIVGTVLLIIFKKKKTNK